MAGEIEVALQAVVGGGGSPAPSQLRTRTIASLQSAQSSLNQLADAKTKLDDAVTETSDEALTIIQSDWADALADVFDTLDTNRAGSIVALASVVKDISVQAGFDGTTDEMRLYKGSASPQEVVVP